MPEPRPTVWETWMEFAAPGFGLAGPRLLWPFGIWGENSGWRISFSKSAFQYTNKYFKILFI